jgi:acetyltransferase-like isoleucine patch superfamily enzyme
MKLNFWLDKIRKKQSILGSGVLVHTLALCESTQIGNNTRIWAFSHVLPFAEIGEDCNICENVFIENGARVGNNVTIKNGVQLWDGISIENDVFIGPNVTFCNDKYPQSGNRNFDLMPTTIKQGASIGANATILPGIQIGQFAIVGAGSVVTKDVHDYQVVAGNPAKQIRDI